MSDVHTQHFGISDELPPRIKPGEYDLSFVRYETARMFRGKAEKLVMYFKIVSMGEYFDAVLPRYYNVEKIGPKRRTNGRFKAGTKGDFLREYCTLFPNRIGRRDRIPMSPFKNCLIRGNVVTVKEARGRPIPPELQYSKIAQLLEVVG